MRTDLPAGTVTFRFTDVEGSTRLLHELGPEAYAQALSEHRVLLRSVFAVHGGAEVDTQGDAFFVAFPTASGAAAAALAGQRALSPGRFASGWVCTLARRPWPRRGTSVWTSIAVPGWPRSPTAARSGSPRPRRR